MTEQPDRLEVPDRPASQASEYAPWWQQVLWLLYSAVFTVGALTAFSALPLWLAIGVVVSAGVVSRVISWLVRSRRRRAATLPQGARGELPWGYALEPVWILAGTGLALVFMFAGAVSGSSTSTDMGIFLGVLYALLGIEAVAADIGHRDGS